MRILRSMQPAPNVLYQPFYCEENIFHLCDHPKLAGRSVHAVVVSGAGEGFVMWHQRAARSRGGPIFWDYHVFALVEDPWEVWDLDTLLGFPVAASLYFERSFRRGLPRELAPIFRVVPKDEYRRSLVSDRSHMLDESGHFQRPPPPWPPVTDPSQGSNLHKFIDMTAPFVGELLSLDALAARFSDQ